MNRFHDSYGVGDSVVNVKCITREQIVVAFGIGKGGPT